MTELNARIEAQLAMENQLSGPALARARILVRRQVEQCALCPLRQTVERTVPYSGPRYPAFVAVGEAPGLQEERRGAPFVGPSGKLLRTLMEEVGTDVANDVLFCNTVSCHPKKGASVTRAPTEQEQRICRGNLLSQIELGSSPYVLMVGATALSAFRNDLKVSEIHGRIFIWDYKYLVMPVLHPAAALRSRNLIAPLKEDLRLWNEIVNENSMLKYLTYRCVKCNSDSTIQFDPDGVAYCDLHWDRYGTKEWERQKKRWSGETVVPLQFDLDVPVRIRAAKPKREHM